MRRTKTAGEEADAEVFDVVHARILRYFPDLVEQLGGDVMELFAKAVAQRIEADRVKNSFDKLLLIAPPKMLGLLRQSLSTSTRALVAGEVPKDLKRHGEEAILREIPDDTFFH